MDQDPTPIADSIKRHGEQIATTKAEKPASFTVGAWSDGHKHTAAITIDRKWWNGFGLTAYARAWYLDAPVMPNTPKLGGEVGVEGRYDFKPR